MKGHQFHTNIKKLRQGKAVTQQQAADTIGITRSALGSYEECRACPDFETLVRIAKYYQITVDRLLTDHIL